MLGAFPVRARGPAASLALSALGLLASPGVAAAQCGEEVVLRYLDAGTSAPVLLTPKGAPVLGGDFAFQVRGGTPGVLGVLLYSGFELPTYSPELDAIVWPELPWFTWFFGTGPAGISPLVLNTPEVTDDLCGAMATFQGFLFDSLAPGGLSVTNAVRLRVGDVTRPVFEPTRAPLPFIPPPDEFYADVDFGDVDGDGLRDMLLADGLVAFALPGGGFDPPVAYPMTGDVAPLLADLNGDGNVDLIELDGSVKVVLLDAAQGVLQSFSTSTAADANDLTVADFDLDGLLDVALSRGAATDAGWMEGTGFGVFLPLASVPVGAAQVAIESGDMDLDGKADLVVSAGATVVALGNGDGTFAASAPQGPVGLLGLRLADLDGDGELDVAGYSGSSFATQLGDGDGTLQPLLVWPASAIHRDIALADLDGDGLPEALSVAASKTLDAVAVRANLGGGLFGPPVEYAGPRLPRRVAVSDVDLDGEPDVVVVAGGESVDYSGLGPEYVRADRMTIRGTGDGGLRGSTHFPAGKTARRSAAADLNADGIDDWLVLSVFSDEVHVALGSTAGPYSAETVPVPGDPRSMSVADFDGDGKLDLLTGEGTQVAFRPGDGAGGFGAPVVTGGVQAFDTEVGDFDEDGSLDVIAAGTAPSFLAGLGDGTFQSPVALPGPTLGSPSLAVGDLDGDSHADFVLSSTSKSITIYAGAGDGTFGTLVLATAFNPQRVEIADVDGDGNLDLITLEAFFQSILPSANRLVTRRGAGDGTFLGPQVADAGSFDLDSGRGLALADFDDDGRLDAVVCNRDAGDLRLYSGNGDGTFALEYAVPAGFAPVDVAAGDFDGDGVPDAVTADVQTKGLSTSANGRAVFVRNWLGE